MPQDTTDDKSTLVQVMAWCRQATSHYLSQCWPRSMSPNGVTMPQWVKPITWVCLDFGATNETLHLIQVHNSLASKFHRLSEEPETKCYSFTINPFQLLKFHQNFSIKPIGTISKQKHNFNHFECPHLQWNTIPLIYSCHFCQFSSILRHVNR